MDKKDLFNENKSEYDKYIDKLDNIDNLLNDDDSLTNYLDNLENSNNYLSDFNEDKMKNSTLELIKKTTEKEEFIEMNNTLKVLENNAPSKARFIFKIFKVGFAGALYALVMIAYLNTNCNELLLEAKNERNKTIAEVRNSLNSLDVDFDFELNMNIRNTDTNKNNK